MTFWGLSLTNILRHRVRNVLTAAGIAAAVLALYSILSFNRGFMANLDLELKKTGVQFMVMPAGCPHEVAALVLHGAVARRSSPRGWRKGSPPSSGRRPRWPRRWYAVICGPPIMIKFTFPKLIILGFPNERIFTSLERRMKCGIGKCGRCNIGHLYVCKDGPVFSYAQLEKLPREGI